MKNQRKTTETVQQNIVQTIPRPGIREYAEDLWHRGFNVFPLPSIDEWLEYNRGKRTKPDKPPYILAPLFTARLHVCDPGCKHDKLPTFRHLFKQDESPRKRANLGVMTGRTSGNLVAIDCDDRRSSTDIYHELESRGLPFWAYSTHRGQNFLLRLSDGEAENQPKAKIPGVEVWGHNHFMVLPPSYHPEGSVYEWLTPEPFYEMPPRQSIPAISSTDLAWLGVKVHHSRQPMELYDLPEWTTCLSGRHRKILANGVKEGERNNALYEAACDMAGNKIPYHEAEAVLLEAAKRCIPAYPKHETLTTARSAYARNDLQPAKKTQNTTAQTWQKAAAFAGTYDWRATFGRKANSRRRMFLAMVERARLDGRHSFRASVRELADLLARHYGTTIKESINDLITAGLIKRTGSDRLSEARLYQFTETINGMYQKVNTVLDWRVSVDNWIYEKLPEEDAERDVFKKLGFTAYLVWENLKQEPARSIYSIARRLNLAYSSVYKAVKRLEDIGFITHSEAEGHYIGENLTPGAIVIAAIELEVHGKAARIRAMHRVEREIHNNWTVFEAVKRGLRLNNTA